MTATSFFRSCKELGLVRWRCGVNSNGTILLIRNNFVISDSDPLPPVDPVVAVALEQKNYFPTTFCSPGMLAADKLGLNFEFACLVLLASMADPQRLNADKKVYEIRSELMNALNVKRDRRITEYKFHHLLRQQTQ